MSRRLVGFIIAAAGAALVFIAAAADLIGVSSGGSADMFGKRQIIGTVVGAVIVVAGLVVAFVPQRLAAQGPAWHVSEPGTQAIPSPGVTAGDGVFLAPGTAVAVAEQHGDWVLVVAPGGRKGWVLESSLLRTGARPTKSEYR